jgi:hypothetical protein
LAAAEATEEEECDGCDGADPDGSLNMSDSVGEAKPVSYMKLGMNGYSITISRGIRDT